MMHTPLALTHPRARHTQRALRALTTIAIGIGAAALLASCSKAPPTDAGSKPPAVTSMAPLPAESANVLRGRLGETGLRSEYAAHFEADQLTRVIEQRRDDRGVYGGEYEFKGARLLHYRGSKLADAAELELTFDMRGVLLSGAGPNVSEEDISAVRDRSQLLRNHALAQRATRMHH